jgi:hypothetical protein
MAYLWSPNLRKRGTLTIYIRNYKFHIKKRYRAKIREACGIHPLKRFVLK